MLSSLLQSERRVLREDMRQIKHTKLKEKEIG
jgi:hypothetical protein